MNGIVMGDVKLARINKIVKIKKSFLVNGMFYHLLMFFYFLLKRF